MRRSLADLEVGRPGTLCPAAFRLILVGAGHGAAREDHAMDRRGIGHVRSFGDPPQNPVQLILGSAVILAEVHPRGLLRAGRFECVLGQSGPPWA